MTNDIFLPGQFEQTSKTAPILMSMNSGTRVNLSQNPDQG